MLQKLEGSIALYNVFLGDTYFVENEFSLLLSSINEKEESLHFNDLIKLACQHNIEEATFELWFEEAINSQIFVKVP